MGMAVGFPLTMDEIYTPSSPLLGILVERLRHGNEWPRWFIAPICGDFGDVVFWVYHINKLGKSKVMQENHL